MMIIGVDYHPSFQTIAFLIEETGECGERELKEKQAKTTRGGGHVSAKIENESFGRWWGPSGNGSS